MKESGASVVVLGATGNQGGAVLRALSTTGYAVRALVRDPKPEQIVAFQKAGAEVVHGDLRDRASLEHAFRGAHGVFAVLPFFQRDFDDEVAIGETVVAAARSASIHHLVYSSGARANLRTGVPHLDSKGKIEELVKRSGLPYTILRPVAFNYSLQGYREGALKGVLADARTGESMVYQLAERDYARLVALAFSQPSAWKGEEMDVASDALTVSDLAALFGRVLGRPVRHEQVSWEEETRTVGEEVVRLMHWVDRQGPCIDVRAMRARFPWMTTLETYLEAAWSTAVR